MFWLKVILYSMILALAGCGGDSAPNNDNSGGLNGGDIEITPPTVSPSSKSIRTADFHLTFDTNTAIDALNVNFSTFVSSMENKSLSITEIAALSKDAHCQILSSDPKRLQFAVSPKTAKTCVYRYTVTDGIASTEGMGRVTFSASQSNRTQKASSGISTLSTVLPSVSKSTTLGETLTFSLADELSTELTLMTHPLFSEAIAAYGTGVPIITESGDVTYDAVATGSSLSYFHILDDQNTPDDKSDDMIYNGTLIIDVSGTTNNPPSALDAEYSTLIPAGNEIEIDITDFEGSSLIDDADGDSLQLVAAYTTNAFVELSDSLDVNNTKFKFKSDSFGEKKVNYVIYDHNKDGVTSGELTLNIGYSNAGKSAYNKYGFIKLFDSGTLAGISTLTDGGVDVLQEFASQLEERNLKVVNMYNTSAWQFAFELDNGQTVIVLHHKPDFELYPIEAYITYFDDVKYATGISYGELNKDFLHTTLILHNDNTIDAVAAVSYVSDDDSINFNHAVNSLALTDVKNIYPIAGFTFLVQKNDLSVKNYQYLPSKNTFEITDIPNPKRESIRDALGINKFSASISAPPLNIVVIYENSVYTDSDDPDNILTLLKDDDFDFIDIISGYGAYIGLYSREGTLHFQSLVDGTKKTVNNVKQYKSGGSFIGYITNDNGFNVLSVPHKLKNKDGDIIIDNAAPKELETPIDNVKFFSVQSDSVLVQKMDNTISKLNYLGETPIPELNGIDYIDSGKVKGYNLYTNKIQEGNTFIARNSTQKKWYIYQDVLTSELSSCLSTELEEIIPPQSHGFDSYFVSLFYSCSYEIIHYNGAIDFSKGVKSIYPKDIFEWSDYLFELKDLDNDGLDNSNECPPNTTPSETQREVYCLSPVLNDSDLDGVSDKFETMYIQNAISQKSHLSRDYSDIKLSIDDRKGDVNKNGVFDFLE